MCILQVEVKYVSTSDLYTPLFKCVNYVKIKQKTHKNMPIVLSILTHTSNAKLSIDLTPDMVLSNLSLYSLTFRLL